MLWLSAKQGLPPRSGGMEAVLWLSAKQQVQGLQPPLVPVSCRSSVKWRHGGCPMAPGKTAGTGRYPAPLVPVSCRYLLVNCCSFFSYKRGKFLPDLEKWPNLHACDSGRCRWAWHPAFVLSPVRQPCCIIPE